MCIYPKKNYLCTKEIILSKLGLFFKTFEIKFLNILNLAPQRNLQTYEENGKPLMRMT
jgi:hypothetical protein